MSATRDWSPLDDMRPNMRDIFAMNESTTPNIDVSTAEKYIGLKPGEFDMLKHWPIVKAKWRYECADAMLKYGGYTE